MSRLKRPGLPLALASLLLSCAQPRSDAAQQGAPPASAPIRYGDPDELAYAAPFFPGATYDAAIPTPDAILGQRQGTRLSHHAEILACFNAWSASSPRIRVETFAQTHEGRPLVWAAISTPANLARLDGIRSDLARLHDPRGLADADAKRIVESSPAVAWMGYSIHGDELSGSDAALALGYHLVASQEPAVEQMLAQLVVVIDPCMNPDGRERIIGMVEQSAGRTPNLDYASMQRGRWPYGRGNHYLFDMNRDWLAGTQPETRGRWQAVNSFRPQLFVDAHEMGSEDTFLFYPQAEPFNPNLPKQQIEWPRRYGRDAAAAFDAQGWAYYTREWADAWGPFYSDSWAALTGAVGILYEQAATSGFPLRRESGRILTYREAVHHQVAASWSNLDTLQRHRAEVLADYLTSARTNVAADTPGNDRMFVVQPKGNLLREEQFLRTLLGQGIEVARATEGFEAADVVHAKGPGAASRAFPAGSWLVPARQPARPLVHALLDFDPRYDKAALQREREELERKGRSKAYDVTSWNLAHAFDLDAAWCDAMDVARQPIASAAPAVRPAPADKVAEPAPVAWAVDAVDDRSLAFAARAMELGLAVHASDEPFRVGARTLARGSFLVRRGENEGTAQQIWDRVRAAATFAEVEAVPALTGRAPDDESADLGGGHFQLLARPRVALLANAPVASDAYGHLWHHLDVHVGVPFSILDAQQLGGIDLRRYNVLVVPESDGVADLLESVKEELETWIEGGGTLIACGSSAAAFTKGGLGLSEVVLREDALEELDSYRKAAQRQQEARTITIDEAAVWGDPPLAGAGKDEKEATNEAGKEDAKDDEKDDEKKTKDDGEVEATDPSAKALAEEERRARLFAPQGATLRGITDPDAWITAGTDELLPVQVSGADIFLAREPVATAVRLEEAERLRIAGLVWPEARERLAGSCWLTVEARGRGQIILFSNLPAFRGWHLATARLFANAVVLGPGLGADLPSGW